MRNKRIVAGMLAAFLLLTAVGGVTASAGGVKLPEDVQVLGLLPDVFQAEPLEQPVTRAELAYITVRMTDLKDREPRASRFEDVPEEHPYSGYIETAADLGYMIGDGGDGTFEPDGLVQPADAYRLFLSVLDFRDTSDAETVQAAARQIGLLRCAVTAEGGGLTRGSAAAMADTVLKAEPYIQSQDGFMVANRGKTYLGTRLGISVYAGRVAGVSDSSYRISLKVEKNRYAGNYKTVKEGETINCPVSGDVDINYYDQAPVTVWVNREDEILSVKLDNRAEIRYTLIETVNSDDDREGAYAVPYINRLGLLNEDREYQTGDGFTVRHNNEDQSGLVTLAGKFAKVVLQDNRVLYAESWDMEEGGLLTKVDKDALTYTQGERQNRSLRDLKSYSKKLLFLDGRSADWKELKPNCVFRFYEQEDLLAIAASEKMISDVFLSSSETELRLGNAHYDAAPEVYYSIDGIKFDTDESREKLYQTQVNVYFNIKGEAAYVVSASGDARESKEFNGVLDGGRDLSFGEMELDLWMLGGEVQKETFRLTNKTRYEDQLTFEELASHAKDPSGNGVYRFKVKASGEIKTISRMKPLAGFKTDADGFVRDKIGSFTEGSIGYIYKDNKLLYYHEAPIYAMYQADGQFQIKKLNWWEIQGKSGGYATATFYGDFEDGASVELVTLSGNLEGIGEATYPLGIVIEKSEGVDDSGEKCYYLTIQNEKNSVKTYRVTESMGKDIPEVALVEYYTGLKFSKSEIKVTLIKDLTGPMDEWGAGQYSGLKRGVVSRVSEQMIFFTGDTGAEDGYFFTPYTKYFFEVNEDLEPKLRFRAIDVSALSVGDVVYYQTGGEMKCGLVREK